MNANDLFKSVMDLDLEPIKAKLMHVPSGEGWSRDKADAVEKEYRRFLCLMKLYPDEDTAPLVDVDTFWHYHILDTMKYARDCAQAFGYFLHHYPYVGMRGEDDDQFRIDSGERMGVLYEATFGEAYPGTRTDTAAAAFCAGPGAKQQTAMDGVTAAFCAGPGARQQQAMDGAAAAFCAGPGAKQQQAMDGVAAAFCAGPGARQQQAMDGAATAFCAGPGGKLAQAMQGTATAFCAGPGARHPA